MNTELWNKILDFDFEQSLGEYGFAIRLADENSWTEQFTKDAILEYRKFMYLAATSDVMVSPSPVVDIVWHQHLVFTKSYNDFCQLIGKQVQHIPSTHHNADYQKFKIAKERTAKLYTEAFGKAPHAIWERPGMLDSLNLPKAKISPKITGVIAALSALSLLPLFHFSLFPVYKSIGSSQFLVGYLVLVLVISLILQRYNRNMLKRMVSGFDSDSFIHKLHPYELLYMKNRDLHSVVAGVTNEMLTEGVLEISEVKGIKSVRQSGGLSGMRFQVAESLQNFETTDFNHFAGQMVRKPAFTNVRKSATAFRKYFYKSKQFARIFNLNAVVLLIVFLLGLSRMTIGISRDKPVLIIGLIMVFVLAGILFFLVTLVKRGGSSVITDMYRNGDIVHHEQAGNDWQWNYFLLGAAVLLPSFVPIYRPPSNTGSDSSSYSSSDSSSSGDSSCGSSCSSCGGCGGD